MKHLIKLILQSLGAYNISYSGKERVFYFNIEKPLACMFVGIKKKSDKYLIRRDKETFYKLCRVNEIHYPSNLLSCYLITGQTGGL